MNHFSAEHIWGWFGIWPFWFPRDALDYKFDFILKALFIQRSTPYHPDSRYSFRSRWSSDSVAGYSNQVDEGRVPLRRKMFQMGLYPSLRW